MPQIPQVNLTDSTSEPWQVLASCLHWASRGQSQPCPEHVCTLRSLPFPLTCNLTCIPTYRHVRTETPRLPVSSRFPVKPNPKDSECPRPGNPAPDIARSRSEGPVLAPSHKSKRRKSAPNKSAVAWLCGAFKGFPQSLLRLPFLIAPTENRSTRARCFLFGHEVSIPEVPGPSVWGQ